MKNKLSLIILMLLVLINVALGSTTNSYAASNTPLENMTPGDKIKFAGKEWIILDPSVGYIILASNDGNRQWDADWNNDYASSDIRKYLNGEFLNSLKEENKDLIMEVIWNCGPEGIMDKNNNEFSGETSKKVRDKVGLLTYSEYKNYSKYYNTSGVVLDPNDWNYVWWLLTPNSGGSDGVCGVGSDGYLGYLGTDFSRGVRPALYL